TSPQCAPAHDDIAQSPSLQGTVHITVEARAGDRVDPTPTKVRRGRPGHTDTPGGQVITAGHVPYHGHCRDTAREHHLVTVIRRHLRRKSRVGREGVQGLGLLLHEAISLVRCMKHRHTAWERPEATNTVRSGKAEGVCADPRITLSGRSAKAPGHTCGQHRPLPTDPAGLSWRPVVQNRARFREDTEKPTTERTGVFSMNRVVDTNVLPLCIVPLGNEIDEIDAMLAGYPGVVSSYLIRTERPCLIEVGTSGSAPVLKDAVIALGLAPEDLATIVVTHIHLDHAGGTGDMATLFPNAEIVVH